MKANLQLEGLIMAVAAINNMLVHRGILSIDDIDAALQQAERGFTSDERLFEDMSQANREAVCFPIRLLQLANRGRSETSVPTYAELVVAIGGIKSSSDDGRAEPLQDEA